MSKEVADCFTLEMFPKSKKRGRPKINPLSRKEQNKINKKKQQVRDKKNNLKRVEIKLSTDLCIFLSNIAEQKKISRNLLIETIIQEHIHNLN